MYFLFLHRALVRVDTEGFVNLQNQIEKERMLLFYSLFTFHILC